MSYCLLLFKQNRSSNSFNQIAAINKRYRNSTGKQYNLLTVERLECSERSVFILALSLGR